MKRYYKTKAGFSLMEIIVVIAIIVILAGVIAINIGTYIQRARNKSASGDELRSSVIVNISDSETRLSALGFDRLVTSTSQSYISIS